MNSETLRRQNSFVAFESIASLVWILFVALIAVGCASTRPPTSGKTIRIMTWNIHHAEGIDHDVDVNRIAKLIRSESPDIVALQEVDRGVQRTKKMDIITMLADKTDMTYAFGKTMDFQGGDYGNAMLTRFPILEEHNIQYKTNLGREQRGLMVLILDVRGDEVAIANTHLDDRQSDSARAATIDELSNILKAQKSWPAIACGDFNFAPASAGYTALSKDFTDTWTEAGTMTGYTYPSDNPDKRIDYLFIRKNQKPDSASSSTKIQSLLARVVSSSASDHLPLVVELELQSER